MLHAWNGTHALRHKHTSDIFFVQFQKESNSIACRMVLGLLVYNHDHIFGQSKKILVGFVLPLESLILLKVKTHCFRCLEIQGWTLIYCESR